MTIKFQRLIGGALIGLPIVILALFIAAYSVNVPFEDEWDTSVYLAARLIDGMPTFRLGSLLAPHNEHRILPTKLTIVLSTWLTDWDGRFETWVSFGLALLTFLLLLDLLRLQGLPNVLTVGVPLAWLVFSLRQVHNWLIGFQTQFFYAYLFSVLAVWLLMRLRVGWRALGAAALSAFAASWSFSGGLPLWIALLPALWLRGYRRWQHYAGWLGAMALCLGVYFTLGDYTFFAAGGAQTPLLYRAAAALTFLGAPFTTELNESVGLALAVGAMGVALVAWNALALWRRTPKHLLAPPVTLFLLSLANAALVALRRAPMPDANALASRYVTSANYLWIALLMLGALNLLHGRRSAVTQANRLALLSLIPLYIFVNGRVLLTAEPRAYLPTQADRRCVLSVLHQSDQSCVRRLYFIERNVIDRLPNLAERRLSLFGDWQADFPPAAQPARAHVQPILGVVGDERYRPRWIEQTDGAALLQPPTGTAEQHLQLPDAPRVFFEAELYVDSGNLGENPAGLPRVVDFRLGIREGRQVRTLYEGSFEVNVETAPIPIRVDLSAWRGKAVVLVYETLVREGNPNFAWAMWRNPRLVTQ